MASNVSNANLLSRSSSTTDNSSALAASVCSGGGNNLPHAKAIYVASDVVVVSSNSSSLCDQAKVVLDQYFNHNTRPRDTSFERKSIGGYEASESSDSEAYNNNDQQKRAGNVFGKSVGIIGSQLKQSNSNTFGLTRQSSFNINTSLASGASTSSFKPTVASEEDRCPLWRSASQGSFNLTRTSLRFLNMDIDPEKNDLYEVEPSNTATTSSSMAMVEEETKKKPTTTSTPQDLQAAFAAANESTRLSYEKEFLIYCSNSSASQGFPPGFGRMKSEMPDIVKEVTDDG